jgi:hypothetical protein
MTLKQYIAQLNAVVKENPSAANFIVITSSDDEGNSYSPIYYSPTLGHYDSDDKNFVDEKSLKDYGLNSKKHIDAVCVN